jgi:hypothetical protein
VKDSNQKDQIIRKINTILKSSDPSADKRAVKIKIIRLFLGG